MSAPPADKFDGLSTLPPDGIFHLAVKAHKASDPKADLVVGAYRDEHGLPYPLKTVRKAEHRLLDMQMNYEYLPIAGYPPFIEEATRLVYADTVPADHLVGVQTLSGTGAVSLGAEFLAEIYDPTTTPFYIPNPTWPNHLGICKRTGWQDIRSYSYYDPKTVSLDLEGMKKDMEAAPEGSIFLLHQCAHNPTGVDPTHEQWAEIADLLIAKKHQVFFDSAYQGYASGSLDADAFAARLFAKKGIQFILAQSFSKNLGLYNERVGTLSVVLANPDRAAAVKTHLEALIRASYSNPPAHGARLVHLILSSYDLRKEWEAELADMASRIQAMRRAVYDALKRLKTPGSWEHVINQIGMFSFLGLTKEQCQYCQDHNVFITLTGRANMAGLTHDTALLLAKTIDAAVRNA